MYIKLSTGSSDNRDGDGLIRLWVDNDMVVEYQRNTLPTNGGHLKGIVWGNYWNGGFPKDQQWCMDEVIITTEIPGSTDPNGNQYILPLTQSN
jgi:hypothetical protein